jgi:hypothetical protein
MVTKLVELFANRVVERTNMINVYIRGRACIESVDSVRFEFESRLIRLFFLYSCFIGESCLLVSWCAGGWCGMACSDDDRGRSRRPGAENRRWSNRSGT